MSLLNNLEMLNTWASICGETLDRLNVPWSIEFQDYKDHIWFQVNYSQGINEPAQNWATETFKALFYGRGDNDAPVECEWRDDKAGEFWWAFCFDFDDKQQTEEAFSQGVPVLDYIGFVPNDPLANAMSI